MTRFGYMHDPLCLAGCACYAANRWVLRPLCDWRFLHWHFNDLLLVPCALPLSLWLQRRLGLRRHDATPSTGEILLHLVAWSLLFEGIGPHLMRVTGDPLDVAAYAAGALAAGLWWKRRPTTAPARPG